MSYKILAISLYWERYPFCLPWLIPSTFDTNLQSRDIVLTSTIYDVKGFLTLRGQALYLYLEVHPLMSARFFQADLDSHHPNTILAHYSHILHCTSIISGSVLQAQFHWFVFPPTMIFLQIQVRLLYLGNIRKHHYIGSFSIHQVCDAPFENRASKNCISSWWPCYKPNPTANIAISPPKTVFFSQFFHHPSHLP